jgi:hypothetical protein
MCPQKYETDGDSELLGFGLFPSSGIVGTRKHDVSETVSDSVLRCGRRGGNTYSVGSQSLVQ